VILPAYDSQDQLSELRHCMAYFLNFPRGTHKTLINLEPLWSCSSAHCHLTSLSHSQITR
jgi:hypothetical protein